MQLKFNIGDNVIYNLPTTIEDGQGHLFDKLVNGHHYKVEGVYVSAQRGGVVQELMLKGFNDRFPAEWFRNSNEPALLWNRLAAKLEVLVPQALQAGADAVKEVEQALQRAVNTPPKADEIRTFLEWMEENISRDDRTLVWVEKQGYILYRAGFAQLGPTPTLRELVDLEVQEWRE